MDRGRATFIISMSAYVLGLASLTLLAVGERASKGVDGVPLLMSMVLAVGMAVVAAAALWTTRGALRHWPLPIVMLAAAAWLVPLVVAQASAVARSKMGRQPCASNLRQIGQAMLLYAIDHGGACPPTLTALAVADDRLHPAALVCPYAGVPAAGGATPAERRAAFASARHVSYHYLAAGRRITDLRADEIVACDPPTNHPGAGSNALFGDGHVEYLEPAELPRRLARYVGRATGPMAATQSAPTTDVGRADR